MTRLAEVPLAPARSWSTSALLWIIALTTMSVFQFWRGAPIDGLIFGVVSVVIVVDRVVRLRRGALTATRSTPSSNRRFAIIVAGAIIAGLVLVVAPRTGTVSIALVAAVGLAAVALDWNRAAGSPAHSPQSRRRSRIAWASVGITLCVWEALAYVFSVFVPRGWIGFPTVSLLLEPAVDLDPTRALLTAAWLAAGVWLVTGAVSQRSTARARALA